MKAVFDLETKKKLSWPEFESTGLESLLAPMHITVRPPRWLSAGTREQQYKPTLFNAETGKVIKVVDSEREGFANARLSANGHYVGAIGRPKKDDPYYWLSVEHDTDQEQAWTQSYLEQRPSGVKTAQSVFDVQSTRIVILTSDDDDWSGLGWMIAEKDSEARMWLRCPRPKTLFGYVSGSWPTIEPDFAWGDDWAVCSGKGGIARIGGRHVRVPEGTTWLRSDGLAAAVWHEKALLLHWLGGSTRGKRGDSLKPPVFVAGMIDADGALLISPDSIERHSSNGAVWKVALDSSLTRGHPATRDSRVFSGNPVVAKISPAGWSASLVKVINGKSLRRLSISDHAYIENLNILNVSNDDIIATDYEGMLRWNESTRPFVRICRPWNEGPPFVWGASANGRYMFSESDGSLTITEVATCKVIGRLGVEEDSAKEKLVVAILLGEQGDIKAATSQGRTTVELSAAEMTLISDGRKTELFAKGQQLPLPERLQRKDVIARSVVFDAEGALFAYVGADWQDFVPAVGPELVHVYALRTASRLTTISVPERVLDMEFRNGELVTLDARGVVLKHPIRFEQQQNRKWVEHLASLLLSRPTTDGDTAPGRSAWRKGPEREAVIKRLETAEQQGDRAAQAVLDHLRAWGR